MNIYTPKFPTIEAIQWHGYNTNEKEIEKFIGRSFNIIDEVFAWFEINQSCPTDIVRVWEGDYVCRRPDGHIFVMWKSNFLASYNLLIEDNGGVRGSELV